MVLFFASELDYFTVRLATARCKQTESSWLREEFLERFPKGFEIFFSVFDEQERDRHALFPF